jgi:hypothetical protein
VLVYRPSAAPATARRATLPAWPATYLHIRLNVPSIAVIGAVFDFYTGKISPLKVLFIGSGALQST